MAIKLSSNYKKYSLPFVSLKVHDWSSSFAFANCAVTKSTKLHTVEPFWLRCIVIDIDIVILTTGNIKLEENTFRS